MSVVEKPVHGSVENLAQAMARWVEEGDEGKLVRWIKRELDAEGVPVRLSISEWMRCLDVLAAARCRGEWPTSSAEAIAGLVLAALRFTRPDGRPALHDGNPESLGSVWHSPDWRRWYRGTGIGKVLGWWLEGPSRRTESAPPPLPTWFATDRVLGMLRPDWLSGGDFLAIDHRDPRIPCRFELFGRGRTWLGPGWDEGLAGPATKPRPVRAMTSAAADLLEWSYRAGGARITRSALLLRGRRLAMLSILVEGGEPGVANEPTLRLSMGPTIVAGSIKESRGLSLHEAGRRGVAQALPIALPCRPYPTDRGSFRAEGREIILKQAAAGRRCWLPLLVSWHAERHRKPPDWRVLTVTEKGRIVAPDRALAARVSWGRGETYIIYRSLGSPARRAFLGHQTAVRFLFAEFDEDGDLEPLLAVE